MDLAIKPMENSVPAAPEPSRECSYPGFSIQDDAAESFLKEHDDLEVGQELIVTMRLKLSGVHDSQGRYDSGKRVEFECLSLDSVQAEEVGDDARASEEEGDEEDSPKTGNPAIDRLMRKHKDWNPKEYGSHRAQLNAVNAGHKLTLG